MDYNYRDCLSRCCKARIESKPERSGECSCKKSIDAAQQAVAAVEALLEGDSDQKCCCKNKYRL